MNAPDDFDPVHGLAQEVYPNVRRIVAPNPSPMTYRGTNTYLVGQTDVAVIDPGPVIDAHLTAILDAVGTGQRISHILVTHSHVDHSPLARVLSDATGAPVLGYGDSYAGRSAVMTDLDLAGLAGGGEGVDPDFAPDITIPDGGTITANGWTITAHWTPGHFGNHMCFEYAGSIFTGDLVMGWASSLVSPPDGDLTDFMASCRRLATRDAGAFLPGHGAAVTDPGARLDWLINHRLGREGEILNALKGGGATARDLANAIYTDTPKALLGAATRNVFAHLIDLTQQNRVTPENTLSAEAIFHLSKTD